jgi:hypothetical protein
MDLILLSSIIFLIPPSNDLCIASLILRVRAQRRNQNVVAQTNNNESGVFSAWSLPLTSLGHLLG